MPETPLSQYEFGLWREGDTAFKKQMLDHIEHQQSLNLIMDRRVTVVEINRDNDKSKAAKWTTVIAAAVSAAIGGMFGFLRSS